MRIAEQKLKAGEIQATRQLLERVELEYPGRRLDGLYCFLRAETDRHAGRYEEALRHYEMIFKLPQWAGYRDRASYGIADSYWRMGELDKSLKWYKNMKEAFPKFHEEKKGDAVEKLIEGRLARIKAAKTPGEAFFQGFRTGFEPQESEWFGQLPGFPVVRAPGLDGPHALLMDTYPRETGGPGRLYSPAEEPDAGQQLLGGDLVSRYHSPDAPIATQVAFIHTRLIADTKAKEEVLAAANLYRTSHHQWHKLTFKLKAPPAQDCNLKLSFTITPA